MYSVDYNSFYSLSILILYNNTVLRPCSPSYTDPFHTPMCERKRLNLFHNRVEKMHIPILFLLSTQGFCAEKTFESACQIKMLEINSTTLYCSTYLHDNKKSLRIKVTQYIKMIDLFNCKPILLSNIFIDSFPGNPVNKLKYLIT